MGQLLDSVLDTVSGFVTQVLPSEVDVSPGDEPGIMTQITEGIKDVAIIASQFTDDPARLSKLGKAYDAASLVGSIPNKISIAAKEAKDNLSELKGNDSNLTLRRGKDTLNRRGPESTNDSKPNVRSKKKRKPRKRRGRRGTSKRASE